MTSSADRWYYSRAGQDVGPVPLDELARLVESGELRQTDVVWTVNPGRRGGRAAHVVINLLSAHADPDGPQLVQAAGSGSGVGLGVSFGEWADECAAQQEAMYWALAARQTQVAADRPADPGPRLFLAAVYFDLGKLYHDHGRDGAAEWAYGQALAIREEVARSRPEAAEYQKALGSSHNQLGLLHRDRGDLDRAEASIRTAIDIRSRLVAADPADREAAVYLGGAWCNLGLVLTDRGRPAEAVECCDRAAVLLRPPAPPPGRRSIWAAVRERLTGRGRARAGLEDVARQFLANTEAARAAALEKLAADPGG